MKKGKGLGVLDGRLVPRVTSCLLLLNGRTYALAAREHTLIHVQQARASRATACAQARREEVSTSVENES